ncbi:acetyltransferase protein [Spatholobus suberectus]|nr:acetyltransferase protein [Spatholobus suberectus]
MCTPAVRRISECFVKPHRPTEESNQICYLTPWDILMLSTHYIQKGLLFKKPATLVDEQDFIENLLEKLKHSLSLTLSHFYPLAGRLVTQKPKTLTLILFSLIATTLVELDSSIQLWISPYLISSPPLMSHPLFSHSLTTTEQSTTMVIPCRCCPSKSPN